MTARFRRVTEPAPELTDFQINEASGHAAFEQLAEDQDTDAVVSAWPAWTVADRWELGPGPGPDVDEDCESGPVDDGGDFRPSPDDIRWWAERSDTGPADSPSTGTATWRHHLRRSRAGGWSG